MQKLFRIFFISLICLSLVACGKGKTDKEPNDPEEVVKNEYKIIIDVENDEETLMTLMNQLKKSVEACFDDLETNSITIYKASDVLKDDQRIEDVLKSGEYDIGIVSSTELKSSLPWLTMLDSWFLFTDYEHYRMLWEDKIGISMKSEINKESGLNVVDTLFEDTKVLLTKQEIDLKEMEAYSVLDVGVIPNELSLLQLQTMGVNAIPIVHKDMYRNFVEGRIDSYEDYLLNVKPERLYELCNTLALTHHQYSYSFLVINSRLTAKMDDEDKVAINEAIKAFVDAYDSANIAKRDSDLLFYKDLGINVESVNRVDFHNAFSNFYRSNPQYTNLWNVEYYERTLKLAKYLQMQRSSN